LMGEDKIDWDKVTHTEWKHAWDIDAIVSQCVASVLFKAKNGKEYLAHSVSNAVISKIEMEKSKTNVEDIKRLRLKNAKINLKYLILSKLEGRKGLRGHKGYFDFQSVKLHRYHN